MSKRIICDGSRDCTAPLVHLCACSRCALEGDDHEERFHVCADATHYELALAKHERIYERSARFMTWQTAPSSVQAAVEAAASVLRAASEIDGFLIVAVKAPQGDVQGAMGGVVDGTLSVAVLTTAASEVLAVAQKGQAQGAPAEVSRN